MTNEINEQIDLVDDESIEENIQYQYDIISYGADYPVDAIVKRMSQKSIFTPSFQREFVWNKVEASRFIESLLLGLPVPGVFLSKEQTTERLMVIDGQQRLKTLQFFYSGKFKDKIFKLQNVQSEYEGKTYSNLSESDQNRLDNSLIHVTIIQQEKPSEDQSSIYHIFERLNTTGRPLQPQEIRACIYHGVFNELLESLNDNKKWQKIYGKPSFRLKDRELILRFLALLFEYKNYERPMKKFLNTFMSKNRNLDKKITRDEYINIFSNTVNIISECIGEKAFRIRDSNRINAAVFDAIMVGIGWQQWNVSEIRSKKKQIFDFYQELLNDDDFLQNCLTGTSNEKKVTNRITMAIDIFKKV